MMRNIILLFSSMLLAVLTGCNRGAATDNGDIDLNAIRDVRIFCGNDTLAYRDPAVCYHDGTFYLFYSMMRIENDSIFSYVAESESRDLMAWTAPRILTPRNQQLDFSSPGNVVRVGDEWILCLQTYPRPDYTTDQMPRYGSQASRLYIMRSRDLRSWSEPELMYVKGPGVCEADMGRMIDPYLLEDKDEPGKWWCFYKQRGVSMSYTYDFKTWTFAGHTDAGENVCVWVEDDEYVMMHSPKNGLGIKRSRDLKSWRDDEGLITLGQGTPGWEWAKGRLSAGAIIDGRQIKGAPRYLLFFHGSGPLTEAEGDFDRNASLGMAWSDDLVDWQWSGQFRYQNPIMEGIDTLGIRDCQVLRAEDRWYMTGTAYPFWRKQQTDGQRLNAGVPLYRSDDLLHWEWVGYIVERPDSTTWYYRRFWAPEIHRIGGQYVVTFNCSNSSVGMPDPHVGYAVADSVEGPYRVITVENPLVEGNDMTLFEDTDGKIWGFWNDREGIHQGEVDIMKGEVSNVHRKILPLGGRGEWDEIGIEGSCVFHREDRYYLLYSSWTRGYEIGYATAPTIEGPWTRSDDNPIYGAQNPRVCARRGLVADTVPGSPFIEVGHNQVFEASDGRLWLSCHGNVKQNPDHPFLVIDPLDFDNQGNIVRKSPSFTKQSITSIP